MKSSKANNGRIAISVYDGKSLEGYQIKGKAEYLTAGEVVDTLKQDVRVGFLIVYPGAEVHEFITLFLECGQVKDEMRLIQIRL